LSNPELDTLLVEQLLVNDIFKGSIDVWRVAMRLLGLKSQVCSRNWGAVNLCKNFPFLTRPGLLLLPATCEA
jgi:hypothetical protein